MPVRTLLLFFLAAAGLSAAFYLEPGYAVALQGWIVPLLGAVMFIMGTTLDTKEFAAVLRAPFPLLLGVVLQFLLMPLLAYLLVVLLQLPPELAVGLILLGASPGGTASNLITYLSGGNTALSVSMTAVSTLLSFLLTPLLVRLYLDASISLDLVAMVTALAKIVLVPVVLGMAVARIVGPGTRVQLSKAAPALSLGAIALIVAIVIGLNSDNFHRVFVTLVLAVVLHNLLGLVLGYRLARWRGLGRVDARTVAIEVGMQNSALAVVLATTFFTPAAALAGALFSVWHNISGMVGAYLWRK